MRWLKPWSASSGAQKRASASPATSSTEAAAASSTARLFRNDILKARPGQNRKYGVVEREETEVAARVVHDRRAHPADDDRDHQREEEERQQELSGPACGRHRREERANRRKPEVGEHDRGHELPADRLEEERVGRKRHRLGEPQEGEDAERLGQPDGAPVAGGEHEPVEHALVSLRSERPREAQERCEEKRDPQEPRRSSLRRVGREREVKDDEGGEDEKEHRRQCVPRAQLEQDVLAGQCRDVGEIGHARARIEVDRGRTWSGSCEATTTVRPPEVSRRSSSTSPRADSSSAEYGSSRRSRAGSCRSTRQRASRCCIPRENEPTRWCRASQSPERSSSAPLVSRRSRTWYRRP